MKRDLIEQPAETPGGNQWKPEWTDPEWKRMWYLVGAIRLIDDNFPRKTDNFI